jgi:hypothetical protein
LYPKTAALVAFNEQVSLEKVPVRVPPEILWMVATPLPGEKEDDIAGL